MSEAPPLAISTAVTDAGIRSYMKMADGKVILEINPTTEQQIEAAQKDGDIAVLQEVKPWSRLTTDYACAPSSALAAMKLSYTACIIFYQKEDNNLNYWLDRHVFEGDAKISSTDDKFPQALSEVEDAEKKGLPAKGTQIAVTGSTEYKMYYLFYQDNEGYIVSRVLWDLFWSQPARICKAAMGTGIAAVSWEASTYVRVYFQDENFAITEYAFNKTKWSKGSVISTAPKALTSIAAVYWDAPGKQIRVYFQLGKSSIYEAACTDDTWHREQAIFDAVDAQFDIDAFTRGEAHSPVINLYFTTKHGRVLFERVYNRANGWVGTIAHALPRTEV